MHYRYKCGVGRGGRKRRMNGGKKGEREGRRQRVLCFNQGYYDDIIDNDKIT